jgi:hypothetical protein
MTLGRRAGHVKLAHRCSVKWTIVRHAVQERSAWIAHGHRVAAGLYGRRAPRAAL